MIKIIFVCHGRILKYSGKACKINGFTKKQGKRTKVCTFEN